MSQLVRSIASLYSRQWKRHRNRAFLRAAMAACALVAMAGGRVSLRDRVQVDRVLEGLDLLSVFDPHEGVALFNQHVAALQTDPAGGRRAVLGLVAREVAQEPDKADLLGRICLALRERDGSTRPGQAEAIAELCRCLGFSSALCAGVEAARSRVTALGV